jgi:hypothetical protein
MPHHDFCSKHFNRIDKDDGLMIAKRIVNQDLKLNEKEVLK